MSKALYAPSILLLLHHHHPPQSGRLLAALFYIITKKEMRMERGNNSNRKKRIRRNCNLRINGRKERDTRSKTKSCLIGQINWTCSIKWMTDDTLIPSFSPPTCQASRVENKCIIFCNWERECASRFFLNPIWIFKWTKRSSTWMALLLTCSTARKQHTRAHYQTKSRRSLSFTIKDFMARAFPHR